MTTVASIPVAAVPGKSVDDPLMLGDWFPVAESSALAAGSIAKATLLGRDLAVWRGADGGVHAWEDRCPHRGLRFTCGRIAVDRVVCGYHGWEFADDGRCVHVPAHPGMALPEHFRARAHACTERYGLVWACVGTPARDLPPFPEYDDPRLRPVISGPHEVVSSGPRIVENFLDMGHFPFVHGGILGVLDHPEVRDYRVTPHGGGEVDAGVIGLLPASEGPVATACVFWQPQTNTLAHGGSEVDYAYRVVRPLVVILNKVPSAQAGFREAIALFLQPVAPERTVAWIVMAMTNFEQPESQLRAFQDTIFLQDKPIVENQVPLSLPLAPGAELPVRADRMSQAYRAYLRDIGLHYGVVPA